ncbi:MAG: hypothetical protein ACEQSL_00105, partial [Sediminibacterium sp.]
NMKKLFFLAVIATSLAACGGWNDEKRAEVKSECAKTVGNLYTKEDAAKICDCVSTKINEKFPKADFKPSDINDQKNECVTDGKYTDILTKDQLESYKELENSVDSVTKALDAQMTEEMSKVTE